MSQQITLETFKELSAVVLPILEYTWEFLMIWWWVLFPLILIKFFIYFWKWWRADIFWKGVRSITLEIKIPKEVLKPIRSMEQVFSSIWGSIYDPADWWEKWIEGKDLKSISIEIVSIGGEPHFFIRIPEKSRNAVEASIYSQYPDAEISIVDDYTKYVPQDIPNKNWDMWGCDYKLSKEDVYPIKTYENFFEESPQTSKEEKRIDPMSTLLEGLAKFKPGEQLWIQINLSSVTLDDENYEDRGKKIIDKLAGRPEKESGKIEVFETLRATAHETAKDTMEILMDPDNAMQSVKQDTEARLSFPEMMLTSGEREVIGGIERKISKPCFHCYIRFVYLAKKDAFFGGQKAIPFGFFNQFATTNLNSLIPLSSTITKIHKHWFLPWNIFVPRRLFVKKRGMIKRYINRDSPFFPFGSGRFILNIEELATIFHFPGKGVTSAPFVPRVEVKKGEPPTGLPIEE